MNVRIPRSGTALHGKLLAPAVAERPSPGLVFVHGWGDSQRTDRERAKAIAELPCVCLTFDLKGHDRKQRDINTVTRADNLADVIAAIDFLCARGDVDGARIGVVGASYGGYLAVLASAERKLRWLALRVPALYRDEDFDRPKRELNLDGELAAYRRRTLGPDDNRALRAAAAFGGDVLIVASEHDEVVPPPVIANYAMAFRQARSLTHETLAGADHGLSDARSQAAYSATLVEWCRRRLPAGAR